MMIGDFGRLEERDHAIEVAARSIVSLCKQDRFGKGWRPKGVDEVAILLETLGYSQEIVEELWYHDLFALAADVAALVDKYVADERVDDRGDPSWFIRACRDYAVGSLYSGPWVVAVVGLFVFGAALWSAFDTPADLVVTASLGVFAALVVSGFFTQAIARKVTFSLFQDDHAMMNRVSARYTARGALVLLASAAVLSAALVLVGGFPLQESLLGGAYLLASGIFQLSLATLYTLRRFGTILGIVAVTVVLSGIVFRLGFHGDVVKPWEPMVQAAVIGAVGIAVIAATARWLRHRSGGGPVGEPWWPAIDESVRPYAIFGGLYFLAIVLDHVAAGLLHGGRIVYNARYEIAADVALFAAVPLTGAMNVALERLPPLIVGGAAQYAVGEEDAFNRRITRFFARSVGAMALAAVLSWLVVVPLGDRLLPHVGGAPADPTEMRVLALAAAAYAALMLGLYACQVQFFLSRPAVPLAAAAAAVAVCGGVGAWAVITHAPDATPAYGLCAGTMLFAAVALGGAYRAVRSFASTYYAAY